MREKNSKIARLTNPIELFKIENDGRPEDTYKCQRQSREGLEVSGSRAFPGREPSQIKQGIVKMGGERHDSPHELVRSRLLERQLRRQKPPGRHRSRLTFLPNIDVARLVSPSNFRNGCHSRPDPPNSKGSLRISIRFSTKNLILFYLLIFFLRSVFLVKFT